MKKKIKQPIPKTIVCTICKEEKKLDLFPKNKSCKIGYSYQCRDCVKKKYYEKNHPAVSEKFYTDIMDVIV